MEQIVGSEYIYHIERRQPMERSSGFKRVIIVICLVSIYAGFISIAWAGKPQTYISTGMMTRSGGMMA